MNYKTLLIFLSAVVLSSCASIPSVLQGEYTDLTPALAKADHVINKKVRWSGYIAQTINKKDKTCFEVVPAETDKYLRPRKIIPKDSSRFLACKEGFLEPHAFNERMVTITGDLIAYTQQNIGEYEYEYPVVKTDVVYIWRKPPPIRNVRIFTNFSRFHCGISYIRGYCF